MQQPKSNLDATTRIAHETFVVNLFAGGVSDSSSAASGQT
jgi:hypothetical protein